MHGQVPATNLELEILAQIQQLKFAVLEFYNNLMTRNVDDFRILDVSV